jgi:hypothetical protein
MPEQPVEAPPSWPALLTMPSPEQLGLGAGAQAGPSGPSAVLQEVRRLGATDFNLSWLPQGGCRVSLLLPAGLDGHGRHVEATAGTEAEAVQLAMQRAEQVSGQR